MLFKYLLYFSFFAANFICMKALTFAALFSLIVSAVSAQIKTTPIDKKAIPVGIHFAGDVVGAVKYSDKNGDHIVITTETGKVDIKGNDGFRKADLYAYQYDLKDGKPVLSWIIHDLVSDCSVDITCSFVPKTFAVTDLNNDGKAEVWVMYQTTCRGDVSPLTMKIIMYQDHQKFAVRGTTKSRVSDKDFMGGDYKFDDAFKAGPEVFRKYASALWSKNLMEVRQ